MTLHLNVKMYNLEEREDFLAKIAPALEEIPHFKTEGFKAIAMKGGVSSLRMRLVIDRDDEAEAYACACEIMKKLARVQQSVENESWTEMELYESNDSCLLALFVDWHGHHLYQ